MREGGSSGSGVTVLALATVAEADALYHDQAELAEAPNWLGRSSGCV